MSHSFHLRLPIDLKDQLQLACESNGSSLNKEIVERLSRTFEPDLAQSIADAVRPHLAALDDHDGAEAADLIVKIIALLSRQQRAKRR